MPFASARAGIVSQVDAIPDSAVAYYDPREEGSTGTISSISDVTSNNFDLTGGASVISSGINGQQSYSFDGSQTMDVSASSMASTEEFAVMGVAVQQADQNASNNRYIWDGGSANEFAINDDDSNDWNMFRGGSDSVTSNATTPPDANAHVFELVASNTDNAELIIDGTSEIGPSTLSASDLNGLSLGARPDDFGQTEIDYGEVIVLEGTSQSERQNERQRLANNWGITL